MPGVFLHNTAIVGVRVQHSVSRYNTAIVGTTVGVGAQRQWGREYNRVTVTVKTHSEFNQSDWLVVVQCTS